MQSNASLNVDERKVLARSPKAESDTANRVDERVGLLAVDLAPDASDIDVDDVGCRVKVQVPYVLEQHRPRHDLALVPHKILQNLEFARQQIDLAAAAVHRARYQVEL